jgi:hypothetical protein
MYNYDDIKNVEFSEEEQKESNENFKKLARTSSYDPEGYKRQMRQSIQNLKNNNGSLSDLQNVKSFLHFFENAEGIKPEQLVKNEFDKNLNPKFGEYVAELVHRPRPYELDRAIEPTQTLISDAVRDYGNLMGVTGFKGTEQTPPLWPDIENGFEMPPQFIKAHNEMTGRNFVPNSSEPDTSPKFKNFDDVIYAEIYNSNGEPLNERAKALENGTLREYQNRKAIYPEDIPNSEYKDEIKNSFGLDIQIKVNGIPTGPVEPIDELDWSKPEDMLERSLNNRISKKEITENITNRINRPKKP